MATIKHDFWEGCKVRPLAKASDFTALSREQFYRSCLETISSVKEEAEANGLDVNECVRQITRKIAEKYLFFFCVYVLDMKFIDNDYGYRLCFDVQYNKWQKIWVIAREHFKTTIITQASTLWEICKNPEMTCCIYSYKPDSASVFLSQIKKWVETNDMLRGIWSDVFWDDPTKGYEILPDGRRITWKWTSSALEVKRKTTAKEATLEIGGIEGSSRTGAHFSHQIFDDCETPKNVQTGEAIEKLYNQITMAFNTGQTANLNYCFVGTFYAKEDAYTRLIKNHVIESAVIQSCYDENGMGILYSEEELARKRLTLGTLYNWATQMLCNPAQATNASLKEDWLQYWEPNKAEGFKNLNVYTIVDPASGKAGKRHDRTAIWTVGVANGGQLMLIDLVYGSLTFEDKWRSLVQIYKKFHPITIFYEEVGMQSDIDSLRREMERTNIYFPVSNYNPNSWGPKEQRIEKLQFALSMRRLWFPRNCFHQDNDGNFSDTINQFINLEYLSYPYSKNDDALDCLSSIIFLLNSGKIIESDFAMDSVEISRFDKVMKKSKEEEDLEYDPMSFAITG